MRKYLALLLLGTPLITNAQPVVVVRVQQPAELGFSAPWQDTTVTAGDPLILGTDLSVFGGSGEYSYRWTPGAVLSDSTLAQPTATPFDTTTYVLTVTDENGCSVEAEYKVSVVLPLVNIGLVSGWNTSGNPTTNDDKTSDGQGIGSYSSILDGLTANTTSKRNEKMFESRFLLIWLYPLGNHGTIFSP